MSGRWSRRARRTDPAKARYTLDQAFARDLAACRRGAAGADPRPGAGVERRQAGFRGGRGRCHGKLDHDRQHDRSARAAGALRSEPAGAQPIGPQNCAAVAPRPIPGRRPGRAARRAERINDKLAALGWPHRSWSPGPGRRRSERARTRSPSARSRSCSPSSPRSGASCSPPSRLGSCSCSSSGSTCRRTRSRCGSGPRGW